MRVRRLSATGDYTFGQSQANFWVNKALGVGQNVAAISQLSDQEWQRVIGITLTGTFYCCRAAARMMEKQESGAIVNIAVKIVKVAGR